MSDEFSDEWLSDQLITLQRTESALWHLRRRHAILSFAFLERAAIYQGWTQERLMISEALVLAVVVCRQRSEILLMRQMQTSQYVQLACAGPANCGWNRPVRWASQIPQPPDWQD